MADSKSESKTTTKNPPAVRHECPRCHSLRFHKNEFGQFDEKGKFVVDEVVYRCLMCHELVHEGETVAKEVL